MPAMFGGLTADNLEKLGWAKKEAPPGEVEPSADAADAAAATSHPDTQETESQYSYGAAFNFLDRLRKNKHRLSKLTPECLGNSDHDDAACWFACVCPVEVGLCVHPFGSIKVAAVGDIGEQG